MALGVSLNPAPNLFSRVRIILKKLGMNKIVRAHRLLLKKILKKKNVFDETMMPQIEICAKAWGLLDLIERSNMDTPTLEQQSREGLNRTKANPAIKLYLETLDRYQRGIKALGLNCDSKGAIIPTEPDTMIDFFRKIEDDSR